MFLDICSEAVAAKKFILLFDQSSVRGVTLCLCFFHCRALRIATQAIARFFFSSTFLDWLDFRRSGN